MMDGSQGWSEGLEEEKTFALPGFEFGAFQPRLCEVIKPEATFIWQKTHKRKM
jgi:hypothetical protein